MLSLCNSSVPWALALVGGGGISGILGGGVPPGSSNADPILDQKMSFFIPVFKPGAPLKSIPIIRPGLSEIMSSLLRLEQQQKRFPKIYFVFAYFSFFLTHLELKR